MAVSLNNFMVMSENAEPSKRASIRFRVAKASGSVSDNSRETNKERCNE